MESDNNQTVICKTPFDRKAKEKMQLILSQTYCAFCDAVAETLNKLSGVTESIGRARAANALAHMGYHEEAKKVMTGYDV